MCTIFYKRFIDYYVILEICLMASKSARQLWPLAPPPPAPLLKEKTMKELLENANVVLIWPGESFTHFISS